MYTIIGGDGKEYGPVTTEQVRTWIAAGRANLDTQAKAVGTEGWRRLGDFPEFSQAAAPAPAPAPGVRPAVVLPGRAQPLDILRCYERSWELLKSDFLPMVGIAVAIFIIQMILLLLQRLGVYFISSLFSGVLYGGWYYYLLLKIRGEPATFMDGFAGFTRSFLNLVGLGLLVMVFFVVGLCLLVIPGIYLIVSYTFAYALAIDKGLGIWESMETSRRTITRQWWRVFGLLLLGIPFAILGFLCLGVGIFVAMPLIMGATAYAYEDLCNPPSVSVEVPGAVNPA